MTYDEKLRHHCQDRALEWFSAIVMIAWGITLAWPGDTLDGDAFTAFRRHGMTEAWWAVIFGAAGAARIAALYINGRQPKTPYVRMAGSLFGAVSWAQIAYLLFEGSHMTGIPSTGVAIYTPLAVAELVSIFRAAFDARYYRT
jgi:hypothetical protein